MPSNFELVNYVKDCIASGKRYRDNFKDTWDEIEEQIRLEPPDAWDNKEDWQTKVYLPMQAQASETAFAKLKKLLFTGKFFDTAGVEQNDQENSNALVDLFYQILAVGKFEPVNDDTLRESVDMGASFIKFMLDESGVPVFVWRSAYNCFFDPECGNDFNKAKWWVDEFKRDIGFLIAEVNKSDSLYDKKEVQALLDDLTQDVTNYADEDLAQIKSIDGVYDVVIPKAKKNVSLHEYWGLVKELLKKQDEKTGDWTETSEYIYKWRVITMANEKFIIRNDENEFGFIPAQMMIIKPLKYETYGRGFLEPARGLQDLANSMINLGFDDLKINSMPIILLDETKVADPASIEYRPIAVWRGRGDKFAEMMTSGRQSSLLDILRGINFLDQMFQDATGVTRHAQGTPALTGQAESETLGEYQMKMQAIDERFLVVGKVIENKYLKPLLEKLYAVIRNPKLFKQETIDQLIGLRKTSEIVLMPDPITGAPTPQEKITYVPRILQKDLPVNLYYDFKIIGLLQQQEIVQMNDKLRMLFEALRGMPELGMYVQKHELLKRLMQIVRLPQSETLVKTDKQVEQEKQQAMQQQMQMQAMGMPKGNQPAPLPNQLPPMPRIPQG